MKAGSSVARPGCRRCRSRDDTSAIVTPRVALRSRSHERCEGAVTRGRDRRSSHQLKGPEARMAVTADDNVVMHLDGKLVARLDEPSRHVDIGGRWGRVARGVIVHEDDGARPKLKRPLHYFARIDRGVVDRANTLDLIGD